VKYFVQVLCVSGRCCGDWGIKCMLLSRRQNVGQNWDLKIANRSFENVTVQIFGGDSNKSKFDSGGN
jgi:hypothetical protein